MGVSLKKKIHTEIDFFFNPTISLKIVFIPFKKTDAEQFMFQFMNGIVNNSSINSICNPFMKVKFVQYYSDLVEGYILCIQPCSFSFVA